jgi:TfoX/Sxy family transcriptional regulator of competence genes
VAYDEELAGRIRALMAGEAGVTEQKMFGGLAFLVNGNMSVAASGQGGILLRVDPEESDALTESTGAAPFVMRGRAMQGWLRVTPEHCATPPRWRGGSTWASRMRGHSLPSDLPLDDHPGEDDSRSARRKRSRRSRMPGISASAGTIGNQKLNSR